MWKELLIPLIPSLNEIVVMLLFAVISFVAEQVRRYTGITIEARHREALQSALANAARLLINSAFTKDHAIDYVIASVPDALKSLKVDQADRDRIGALLQPHVLGQAADRKSLAPLIVANLAPSAAGG